MVPSLIDSGINYVTCFDQRWISKQFKQRLNILCIGACLLIPHLLLPSKRPELACWRHVTEPSASRPTNNQPCEWHCLRPLHCSSAARWLQPSKRLQVQKNQPDKPSPNYWPTFPRHEEHTRSQAKLALKWCSKEECTPEGPRRGSWEGLVIEFGYLLGDSVKGLRKQELVFDWMFSETGVDWVTGSLGSFYLRGRRVKVGLTSVVTLVCWKRERFNYLWFIECPWLYIVSGMITK